MPTGLKRNIMWVKIKNKSEFLSISHNLSIPLLPIDKTQILHVGNNHYELFFTGLCEGRRGGEVGKEEANL